MFRPHDSLNLPTFIHISLNDNFERNEKINLPYGFRLNNPSLERISVKKMKSVEKGYYYPSIDIVFARGEVTLKKTFDNFNEKDRTCGFYRSVQTISRVAQNISEKSDEDTHLNGYMIFAYKTMEDMQTRQFTESWKTWSGARLLCTQMPLSHMVTKLSFFKKVCGQLNFEYILIAKIKNMMVNPAPALNILHYVKPKVCAYVGAYRKIIFEVDHTLCNSLGLIGADYANALTFRMRITYTNNTGYVLLSNDIEFRSHEEAEDCKKITPKKICVEVQTDPVCLERRKCKRTLPRTISAQPVPGMNSDYDISTYPLFPSPNSIIGCVLENRDKILTVGNNYLLVLDNRDSINIDTKKKIIQSEQSDKTGIIKQDHKIENNQQIILQDETNKNVCNKHRNDNLDDGALLRRLKTKYFNSEEYTAKELCEWTPTDEINANY